MSAAKPWDEDEIKAMRGMTRMRIGRLVLEHDEQERMLATLASERAARQAAEAEVAELKRQRALDTYTFEQWEAATKWLEEHAPKHVVDALWAWRNVTENAIEMHRAEIARMRTDYKAAEVEVERLRTLLDSQTCLAAQYKAERDRLAEALRFYADDENYSYALNSGAYIAYGHGPLFDDAGNIARTALRDAGLPITEEGEKA